MSAEWIDGEAAVAVMASLGRSRVRRLWFASGSDLVPYQEAAARGRVEGIVMPSIVGMIHEHVALSAAMGEHMVSNRPVSVVAHADLGLLNFGGAIHNASSGGYAVIMLSGYPATSRRERTESVYWRQQRADQGELVRQYMRWDYKLAAHEDPAVVAARAAQMAISPPAGPVYLAIPTEVAVAPLAAPVRVVGAGDMGISRLGPGDSEGVAEIARRLLEADAPLLVTDRAGRSPEAVQTLSTLAEELAIGVRATRHRMNIADDHPATATPVTVRDADVLLSLEHAVPWIPVHEEPQDGCWTATVGEDPLSRSIPLLELRSDLRLTADPSAFLAALLEEVRRQRTASHRERCDARWATLQRLASERQERYESNLKAESTRTLPSGVGVQAAVAEVIEPDDILTWEMVETDRIPRTRPGSLFEKGGSSLGWAVAAAIGARVEDRERPTVCITGDGSYIFGVSQALLWSQINLDAPVLTVICNNRGYRTGTITLAARYPDGYSVRDGCFEGGTFDPPPDFAAEAEAAGGYGRRVVDQRDLIDVLVEARQAVEVERRPAVVDVWLPAHVTGAHPTKRNDAGRVLL